jgi:hypothetical protein
MREVGIRMDFQVQTFPEACKAAHAGKFLSFGWNATSPTTSTVATDSQSVATTTGRMSLNCHSKSAFSYHWFESLRGVFPNKSDSTVRKHNSKA